MKAKTNKRAMMRQPSLVLIVLAVLIVLVACIAWAMPRKTDKSINSFEECVADGRPVMESYPERCMTDDGRSFTKQY